jgi:hypothetical protein
MSSRVVEVVFEIDAQSYKPNRFTVPAKVLAALDLEPGDEIELRVEDAGGQTLWSGVKRMVSGAEIDHAGLNVQAGQRIRVSASRPG